MIPRVVWALLVLACAVSSARAQQLFRVERGDRSGPLEVEADSVTAAQEGRLLTGTGHVAASWEGYRLHSATVVFDRETSLATADGAVVLEDGDGNLLRCARLVVNVKTQEGVVEDGTLWIAREGYRVWGKRFHKTGPDSYRVEDGGFTPCDGTWPSWRVNGGAIDVRLEGYLVARDAAFWVEGLPVAYTPYLVFPVKRTRQSGFLLPKLGLSGRDGLILAARYYWAFSDSADLTARLEYRSRRGWTEQGSLRYVLAEGHEGSLDVTHLWDRQDRANRYTVLMEHSSKFDDITRARLHVDYVGDKRLLQDLGDTIDQRGVERKEDYLLVTRDGGPGTAFGLARYVQALKQPQAPVLQTLPQLGLEGRETPLWGPLALEPTVRFTNYSRREGTEGQRAEVVPGLAWDSRLGGLGLAARLGYRENLYRVDTDWLSRGAATAGAAVSATFARRYGAGYVHTLEPRVAWSWQEAGRGPQPEVFDTNDVFAPGSALGFLVESRLVRARDLAAVAGVDLERRLDVGALRRGGWGEAAFGPWRGKATVTPNDVYRFRAEGQYDPAVRDPWLLWSVDGEAKDGRGDRLTAGVHYVKRLTGYVDVGVEVPLTPSLSAQYRNRFSVRDHRSLEQGLGLHLLHQCWELLATVSRNYQVDEKGYENRFFLSAQLRGLGSLGTLRGIVP